MGIFDIVLIPIKLYARAVLGMFDKLWGSYWTLNKLKYRFAQCFGIGLLLFLCGIIVFVLEVLI